MKIALIIYIIIAYGIAAAIFITSKSKITLNQALRGLIAPIIIPIGIIGGIAKWFISLCRGENISKKVKIDRSRKERQSENLNDENFTHKEDDIRGITTDHSYDFTLYMRRALKGGQFNDIINRLGDTISLNLYRNRTILGREQVISYWKDWTVRYQKQINEGDFIIRFCSNYSRYGLNIKLENSSAYIYFREENGTIVDMVYINEWATEGAVGFFCSTNNAPYSLEYFSKYIEKEIPATENSMPCLQCGCKPSKLKWNRFTYPVGIHGYGGEISVCPHCNRIVDIFTNIRFRYETPQSDKEEFRPKDANNGEFPIGIYGRYSWSCDDVLKDSGYKNLQEALDNNVWEAANNLGMLAANQDRIDEAKKYFQLAISNGNSHNAMLNITMLYWATLEEHSKAVELMKAICSRQEPAIRCLWNLAYLQFVGDKLEGNPLTRDLRACRATLEKIISLEGNPIYEKDSKIIQNAKSCLSFTVYNQFSEKGKELHTLIARSGHEDEYEHDARKVLNILDNITIPHGKELACYHANMRGGESGDNTFLYISDSHKTNGKVWMDAISNIWKNIIVDASEMGLWQTYLLMTSVHVMRYHWHGGYQQRTFIFDENVANTIEPLNWHDLAGFKDNNLLLPSVTILNNSDKQFEGIVYCTYWSEWGGLTRESVRIKMDGNKITNYERIGSVSLFKYDCGILF